MKRHSLIALLALSTLAAAPPALADLSFEPEVTISNQDIDEYKPQVAYNSNHDEYLVVWHDHSPAFSRSVLGKRIDASGNTIEQFTIAYDDTPPRDNASPDVAYDPERDQYLVVWNHDYSGDGSDWDVWGQFIPWDGPGTGDTSFSICGATNKQWTPRVAYANTEDEFLVTWWTEGSGTTHSSVSAQRIDATDPAFPLMGTNFVVTSDPNEERVGPDIAYNRTRNEYLIVYQRMDDAGGNIYGVRLSGTGSILGGGHFGIAAWPDPETNPRVTASGTAAEWGVVWNSEVSGWMKDIYARRVSIDMWGAPQLTAPVLVGHTPIDERYPDIAALSGGRTYLIAWEQQYSNASGPLGITGRTLNKDNVLGTGSDIHPVYVGEDVDSSFPAIAGAAGKFFVAWQQERLATPVYQDILGRAVKIDELFSDGFENGSLGVWSSSSP